MKKSIVAFLACVVVIVAHTPTAAADTYTYTYTGNAFTSYGDHANCSPTDHLCNVSGDFGTYACPPACRVSGWLSVSSPILTYGPTGEIPVVPDSYMFTDGVTIFTPLNSILHTFDMSTNSYGNVAEWFVSLQTSSDEFLLTEFYGSGYEATDSVGNATGTGHLEGDRGTWAIAVPEGSALEMLFVADFVFVFAFAWRKASSAT